MNQNPPWAHLSSCFTITIFFFLILKATRGSSATDPRFLSCRNDTKSCDNGKTEIKFPFFITHLQQPFCGHPGFELFCNENRQTILKLPGNDDYIVHDIFYDNHTIRVSNKAFSDLSTLCDAPIHNLTLLSGNYQLGPETANASLLLNCSSSISGEFSRYSVGCGSGSVLAMFGNDSRRVGDAAGQCGRFVVAPVVSGGGGEAATATARARARARATATATARARLRSGFVLKWAASECKGCEDSGGECGFDLGSHRFQCFCPDRPRARDCLSGKGSFGLKLELGLGLGIGWAVLVAVCLFLFMRRRQKKQKHVSSEYMLRNTCSDPSTAELEEGTKHNGVHIFLYSELEEATNHFKESNEIGDGGFGAVYYGKLKDGREVAVKRLYEHNFRRLEQFINEIRILARLRHKNLVSLYGCTSRRSQELLLVYEFIPNGTLAHHLHGETETGSSMPWPIRINIAIETASALVYLHASDTIHRDVKTDNILLDNNFSVKVADFGLSRLFPVDVTHVSTAPQGTPGYVDPEYHQCYQLTDKSDVYSFGVVLIELISSMPAVDITRHRHEVNLANLALSRIQEGAFSELVDPKLGFDSDKSTRTMILLVAELAFRCLQQDQDVRPDMEEVLETLVIIRSGGGSSTESIMVRDSCTELSDDGFKTKKTEMPPRSPGSCDEIELLKNVQMVTAPASPNSVTYRWPSSSTM